MAHYWLDKQVKNGKTLKFTNHDFSKQSWSYLGLEKYEDGGIIYGNDFLKDWDAVLDGETFNNEFNGVYANTKDVEKNKLTIKNSNFNNYFYGFFS